MTKRLAIASSLSQIVGAVFQKTWQPVIKTFLNGEIVFHHFFYQKNAFDAIRTHTVLILSELTPAGWSTKAKMHGMGAVPCDPRACLYSHYIRLPCVLSQWRLITVTQNNLGFFRKPFSLVR